MNSRNPKKPMAISGNTMNSDSMYKLGGSKLSKHQDIKSQVKKPIRTEAQIDSLMATRGLYPDFTPKDYTAESESRTGTYSKSGKKPQKKDMTIDKLGGSTYKKGGVTKAKKFAALAPPYNKATAADRIAGAKKNARKK
jgi:hypothetical protein